MPAFFRALLKGFVTDKRGFPNFPINTFSEGVTDPEVNRKINELRETKMGGHADEVETSMLLSHRPDLVHDDRGKNQSGQDLNLLKNIPYSYTGIWWYAKYPNHYAGDGSHANSMIGELLINSRVQQLVSLIKTSKKDRNIDELQNRFFKQSEKPLETKQD